LAAALAVLVGLGLALVEVEGVDGNLVPRFKWRFSLRADQRLVPAQAETPGIAADLATTGPNDYPGFLGPGRDGRVPQVELWPDWTSKPPRLVWRRPIGAGWSAFAVVNGYAVTLEQRDAQELVTCYEVRSNDPGGRLLWSHGITARHSTTLGGTGPRSTPTIAGGRVFALGATGVLRCLDGASGRLLWSHDLLAESGLTPAEDEQQVAGGRAPRGRWRPFTPPPASRRGAEAGIRWPMRRRPWRPSAAGSRS
jgi:outer membrane protein assembly factor BamB